MSVFDGKSFWEALGMAKAWFDFRLDLSADDDDRVRAFLAALAAGQDKRRVSPPPTPTIRRLSPPSPAPPSDYVARNLEICRRVAAGETLKSVGAAHGISTVRVAKIRDVGAHKQRRLRRLVVAAAARARADELADIKRRTINFVVTCPDDGWMIVDTPEAMYDRGRQGLAD